MAEKIEKKSRKLISARLDQEIVQKLQRLSATRKEPLSTVINLILVRGLRPDPPPNPTLTKVEQVLQEGGFGAELLKFLLK